MDIKEKEFTKKCKECLPENIMVDGIKYKLSTTMLMGGDTFKISYGEFDGYAFNWDNKHLDLFYTICEVIPEKKQYKQGELQDATIYLTSLDDAISDCIKKLNEVRYEQLDEIVTKETEFIRELISLLNRYSKENGSDTPDFVLAGYLIGCLRVFNAATKNREKWYGRENELGNILSPEVEK
jgi:hypothetical protein